VTSAWHLLTGEYPPSSGGVGDYTRALASELVRRGKDVHVWCPSIASSGDDGAIHLHPLPDWFGARTRQMLAEAWRGLPGVVLLQYVPNALGAGGVNIPFCWWVRRFGRDHEVRVMFHEPYFYFSWSPSGNVRAIAQRLMGRLLVSASRTIYFSTTTWSRYLPASSRTTVLPVPSTIPRSCDTNAAARVREGIAPSSDAEVVGHFGTYGNHVARELEPIVPLLLGARPTAQFVCIGRGSERFAAAVRERHPDIGHRVHHTGPLSSIDVAASIRACDVMVQPYPDGITTRRTSVMAALANRVATVSTAGTLTEDVWSKTMAVALAPAGNARAIAAKVVGLLENRGARASLADAGRRTYDEQFAIEKSVDALLIEP
jgi:glycosyltransferase involved in cell wall biosynthesis